MCDCNCHDNYNLDTLIPKVGVITDIRQETPSGAFTRNVFTSGVS